LLKKRRQ